MYIDYIIYYTSNLLILSNVLALCTKSNVKNPWKCKLSCCFINQFYQDSKYSSDIVNVREIYDFYILTKTLIFQVF